MKETKRANLSQFTDWVASLWLFTANDRRLVIRVQGQDQHPTYLLLDGCLRIETPSAWRFKMPVVKRNGEKLWVLEDSEASVRIEFDSWSIQEQFDES